MSGVSVPVYVYRRCAIVYSWLDPPSTFQAAAVDLHVQDRTRELRDFRVTLAQPMGSKNGVGRRTFTTSIVGAVEAFYSEVMQQLEAWRARAARSCGTSSLTPPASDSGRTCIHGPLIAGRQRGRAAAQEETTSGGHP